MKLDPIYQAIENRNNPDEIENKGPIKGIKNTWLGKGYYFWDGFVECAHWWGEHHWNNDYMICKAYIEEEDDKYLDLYGNTEHMKYFSSLLDKIKEYFPDEKITISQAIAFLREKSSEFKKYTLIRAESPNCGNNIPTNSFNYTTKNSSRLNLCRMIQICSFDKKNVHDYKVIFPQEYNEEWII